LATIKSNELVAASTGDVEILNMMLDNLQNSINLCDRFMIDSNIKLTYAFLLGRPSLYWNTECRKSIRKLFSKIEEMSNNTFVTAILKILNYEKTQLPNLKDSPPVSVESQKAMEIRAIAMEESLTKKYKWREENPEKYSEQKKNKNNRMTRKAKIFKINDIVGVKDREHKWNMARVLFVFKDDNFCTPWYYVHFHNWHDNFREWIGDANRIKSYMPERDFFRR
jgi:hypothetical protein